MNAYSSKTGAVKVMPLVVECERFFSVKRLVKGKKWALRLYGELSENTPNDIINKIISSYERKASTFLRKK